jgi:SAM-dependent methyltransferase
MIIKWGKESLIMGVNNFYTKNFYESLKECSRLSALEIVPLILELIHPKSVVDVGCGLGTWLSVFKEFGISECLGIDGDYIDKNMLEIPPEEFLSCDLKNPLQIDKKFDLVISLEVAEHIPVEYAEIFIDSLTRLGPAVLFSAAIPFQGGTGHLNEQWPHYWAKYFWKNKYSAIDCLRKVIWNNEKVAPWYAQNMLCFVRDDSIKKYPLLEREIRNTSIFPLAIVHPKIYRENVMEIPAETLPRTVETMYVVRVETTEPIRDISPPATTNRLLCVVELEGTLIGTLELPICDKIVTSHILADAITAEFSWKIMGRFFEHTVYRNLNIKQEQRGLSLWRGSLRLGEVLLENDQSFWSQVHEQVGWTVFLQEIWGFPDWPRERFYDPHVTVETPKRYHTKESWLTIEVSEELPSIEVSGKELNITLTVGGVVLEFVNVHFEKDFVHAHELRAALTSASGYELCRVAVREGLLGRSIAGSISLRDRLAASAAARNTVAQH